MFVEKTDSQSSSIPVLDREIVVGKQIGKGSYGSVHILNSETDTFIGKCPWQEVDLLDEENPKDRAIRCQYYWEVEDHCFSKLPAHPQLPPYFGTKRFEKNKKWMVFGFVGNNEEPAPTLSNLMELDLVQPQELKHLGKALGCKTYAETLDKALTSMLTVLDHIHKHGIVHRDIKPSNLLVHDGTFQLIDFGSAADLEPIPGLIKRRRGLENGNRVAISPIYCAPEVFIDIYNAPTKFDIFSAGLLFCQLLFSYLDYRMDTGFHQQLEDTKWDLNAWLSNELGSKLRPGGLDHSLEYLAERPGLWNLIATMLSKDPTKRPSAKQAIKQFEAILDGSGPEDNPFFTMVIESMETCPIPTISRPLHYVATFSRSDSLGLVLSEKDEDKEDVDDEVTFEWTEATKNAQPGEVFIKAILPGSQADQIGIFEVGDQLKGIGELPFYVGGFEKAVEMLQDQPRNAKNVKLHFDRISVRSNEAIPMVPNKEREIHINDFGAWSSKGRRNSQEDAFVVHEIHDTKENSVMIAGVMDGHGGGAASALVSTEIPNLLSNELVVNRRSVPEAMETAWETVCLEYRQQCTDPEECMADYDAREGKLMANTGGKDLIAGTTASVMALDEKTGKLTILNCGDSRSVVATSQGKVRFVTQDHTPQSEENRLQQGVDAGLDYSLPKCRVNRWSLSVGAYEYNLARSLEGPFATSKGIVSDPDINTLSVESGEILLSASDGLWEVMDTDEVVRDLHNMRAKHMSASDSAQALCSMALKKGSSDNVSVVVVFL